MFVQSGSGWEVLGRLRWAINTEGMSRKGAWFLWDVGFVLLSGLVLGLPGHAVEFRNGDVHCRNVFDQILNMSDLGNRRGNRRRH